MTPKEKAKELVDKFRNRSIELGHSHSQLLAEANTLIAVDEILDDDMYGMEEEYFEKRIEYWKEVKQEIERL
jgi:hypothetical protein